MNMNNVKLRERELTDIYRVLKYMARIRAANSKMPEEDIVEEANVDMNISEKFLQAIWNEQKFSGELKTIGGRKLRIISSGIWNNGAGPDFGNAAIVLENKTLTGSVEIHRKRSDWYRHGHQQDERYRNVILHVVWENDTGEDEGKMAVLEISGHFSDEWRKILWELEDSSYSYSDKIKQGECALRWAMTDDQKVRSLLETAGIARFAARKEHYAREIEEKGELRAIIEGMFDVLGYKKNRRQFRMIAEMLDGELKNGEHLDELEKESLVFGMANMLPETTKTRMPAEMREYVERLWDAWWRNGQKERLQMEWDKSETRPYNRPWRRICAGIEIMRNTDWNPAEWIKAKAKSSENPKVFLERMKELNNKESVFRGYVEFDSKAKPAADLLGKERISELLCNAILPFLAAIGEKEGDRHYAELARDTYMALPLSEDNRLIKEASSRFLTPPSRIRDIVKSTCQQQGMLDIYKSFCLALDNNCGICPFSI